MNSTDQQTGSHKKGPLGSMASYALQLPSGFVGAFSSAYTLTDFCRLAPRSKYTYSLPLKASGGQVI